MKPVQNFSKVIIVLVSVFMIIAFFSHPEHGNPSIQPERLEYYLDEGWLMASPDSAEKVAVDLPYSEKIQASGKITFYNILPEEYSNMTLRFLAENAEVRVLLDGEMLYHQETEESSAEGEYYAYIPGVLEDGAVSGELCIELTAVDPNKEVMLGSMIVETSDTLVIGLVGSNLTDIACCLLIVITAIIMFVLAMIRWYTSQPSRGELYLGLFGLTAGVYCFIGTDTLNIFFNLREAYVMQEYLMLMLPLFLALYFDQNLHSLYPRRFAALLCVVVCNAVVQILLEWLQIWNLVEMADISTAVVGLVCAVGIASLLQMEHKDSRYQTLLPVIAVFVLMTGEVAKVVLNAFSIYAFAKVAGLHGMTSSGMMLAILHILQISKEYRSDAEEKVKAAELQNKLLEQANRDADLARQEALAANEAKGKFLAQMSHEIRTPINAVLGMDEMILRESKEQHIKEYAMDIYTAGQTLLSLINDILDFSKIDSGKMEIVPAAYDISSMIHDLVNMASQRAADKALDLKVEIDAQIPSRLYGDDVRIRQVLINILTNAVKYTQEGTVWLRVQSRVVDEKAVLRFEVEDTGIGIKAEDLPKLSAEFERIEEVRNRNIEGTGLGMSITVQLLALLGSRLQVESTYGKGSKFYFELEQKIIDPAPIGDFASKVQQMAQDFHYEATLYAPDAKILVVDDNAVNRKVLQNLLKETAIQVTEAASGAECLQLVQENRYDLIFLDHMMPEMDGVETLHGIKALSECPCKDTPVVVLTANAVSGAKEAYLSEGFDDFLSKPVVPDKLEAMLLKMLPQEMLCSIKEKEPAPKAEFSLEELPMVEGLDWNYACLHLPGQELLAYTVREFYDQIDAAADCLERAYVQCTKENNLEPYRIQVHAMKSLAATVGIISLSGIARVLESAAKDGKINVILSMTAVFLEEWRSYRQRLQGVFGIGTRQGKEITDYSVIQALVEMVRVSMQELDIDSADEWMKQLRAYDFPDKIGQNVLKLAEAVTNLDTEESERLANLLSEQIAGQQAE